MKKIATLALFAGTLAFAQTPDQSVERGPAAKVGPGSRVAPGRTGQSRAAAREKMAERLGLSEAQKAQAKTIFDKVRKDSEPIREEMTKNREALTAAVKADDKAKIEHLSTQQGQLIGKLIAIRSEGHAKFYAILTPEQRVKAEAEKSMMREHMRQRMGGPPVE